MPSPFEIVGSVTQKVRIESALETETSEKIGGGNRSDKEIALNGASLFAFTLTVKVCPTWYVPLDGLMEKLADAHAEKGTMNANKERIILKYLFSIIFYGT